MKFQGDHAEWGAESLSALLTELYGAEAKKNTFLNRED